MNSINSEVYVDISVIISMMPKEMRNRISEGFINFIENNKSSNYKSNINPKIPLRGQVIRKETKEMLGIIYRDYLCSNEERNYLIQNERYELTKLENEKKELYNYDNLFKNKEQSNNTNQVAIIEYKETIIKKIITKIKKLFNREKNK